MARLAALCQWLHPSTGQAKPFEAPGARERFGRLPLPLARLTNGPGAATRGRAAITGACKGEGATVGGSWPASWGIITSGDISAGGPILGGS